MVYIYTCTREDEHPTESSHDRALRGAKHLAKVTLRDFLCRRSSSMQEWLDFLEKTDISATNNGKWNKAAKNVLQEFFILSYDDIWKKQYCRIFLPPILIQINEDVTGEDHSWTLCPTLSHESCLNGSKKIRGLHALLEFPHCSSCS